MNKQKVIKLSNQIYGIEPFDIYSQLQMIEEFLLEKGKEKNKVDLFIKTLSQLPINLTSSFYLTAIKYYMAKYHIFRLSFNNKVILVY